MITGTPADLLLDIVLAHGAPLLFTHVFPVKLPEFQTLILT